MIIRRETKLMRTKPCTHGKIGEIIHLCPNMYMVRNSEQQLYTNLTITLSLHDHRMILCTPRSPCARGPFVILGNNIITLRYMCAHPYRRGHHDLGGLRFLSGNVILSNFTQITISIPAYFDGRFLNTIVTVRIFKFTLINLSHWEEKHKCIYTQISYILIGIYEIKYYTYLKSGIKPSKATMVHEW